MREYVEYLTAFDGTKPDFYKGWWIIGEFYEKNAGMGKEYLEKAAAAYTQLVKGYHKAASKPKNVDGLSDFLNADEAQLRTAKIFATGMLQPDKALPFFKTFKDYYPGSNQASYAEEIAQIIEKDKGGDPTALLSFLKAEEQRLQGDHTSCRKSLEALVRGSPNHSLAPLAWVKLGDSSFYHDKDFEEALESYSHAVESGDADEHTCLAYYQMGECHRELKHWDKAVEEYGQYILEATSKFRVDFAKFYTGSCHEHLGNWDEASMAYAMVADMPKSYWKEKAKERMDEIKNHKEAGTLDLLKRTVEVREAAL